MCHDALRTCQVSCMIHNSQFNYFVKTKSQSAIINPNNLNNVNKVKSERKEKLYAPNSNIYNKSYIVGLRNNLKMNGTFNFGGTVSPKREASSAILQRTLRTISPKYIPDISFSKIWKNQLKDVKIWVLSSLLLEQSKTNLRSI